MILGVVLAGGQATRFGSDKARAMLDGEPLIARLVKRVQPHASRITVVADVAGKYDDLGLTTIADDVPGRGPVGGLLAALRHAAALLAHRGHAFPSPRSRSHPLFRLEPHRGPRRQGRPCAQRVLGVAGPGARLAGRNALAAFDFAPGTLTLTEASTRKRASLYVVRGEEALAAVSA